MGEVLSFGQIYDFAGSEDITHHIGHSNLGQSFDGSDKEAHEDAPCSPFSIAFHVRTV
jgi:hypothetical protein